MVHSLGELRNESKAFLVDSPSYGEEEKKVNTRRKIYLLLSSTSSDGFSGLGSGVKAEPAVETASAS